MNKFFNHIFLTILMCGFYLLQGCSSLPFDSNINSQPFRPEMPKLTNVKVALVLGGGGAKGLAHVGVIEELEKAGIYPDLLVGCSAGALVGALYGDKGDIKKTKAVLLQSKTVNFMDFALSALPFGIVKGKSMHRFLKEHLVARDFHQLKIPLISVATNLQFGNLTVFGQGPLIEPLKASAAYPGGFLPVKIGGQYFVDGGVANPVPVEVARRAGAQFVIAVDISEDLTESPPNHLLGIVKRSLEISYIHQSRHSVKNADIVLNVPFKDIGSFTDKKNDSIYEAGRKTALQMIPEIKQKMALQKERAINNHLSFQ